MNDVAVVICNYNKKELVLDCIKSVFKSEFQDFDLIVVDNASTDGSAEAVTKSFGDRLTLLINEENLGGSGGFNRGMQYAMDKERYKYIHFLDNDVVVDKDALGALRDYMEEHPDVGVCGSLICRMSERDRIQDFGAMVDMERFVVTPSYSGCRVDESLPKSVACDYVAACSAMYRTSVLKKTGVIDKDYFIYWDDIALCFEIRRAGYAVRAISKSKVWHCDSFGERTAFSRYYFFRNKIHGFCMYLDDAQYENFADTLVHMMFRIFAVNKDNPEFIQNYFHAFDDALNGVRGMADPIKLGYSEPVNEKFITAFSGKKNILIIYDNNVDLGRLVNRIRAVTDANIDVYLNGFELPLLDGIRYVKTANQAGYDLTLQLCYHILDVGGYDRSKVYIDRYKNQIIDSEDFDFYSNYESHYAFFRNVFIGFVKDKLDALRGQIRSGRLTRERNG